MVYTSSHLGLIRCGLSWAVLSGGSVDVLGSGVSMFANSILIENPREKFGLKLYSALYTGLLNWRIFNVKP